MIPALFDVGHQSYSGDDVDDYGNAEEGWAAPVAKKFVTYNQPITSEPKLVGHNRDVVDFEMIVLPNFGPVKPQDRMVIDGTTYDVIGRPEDYTKNPFRNDFGCLVINLRVVES